MATVTGLTANRMLDIENASVVSGSIVGDNLHLNTRGGTVVDAGNVRGPQGTTGIQGIQGTQGVLAVWQATHAYTAGNWVLTPYGEAVQSKTTRTSGATFNTTEAANWVGEDLTMSFVNSGFAWSGGGASWDAGVLSLDTSSQASSQVSSGASFAVPGGLSGELTFTEPGTYDVAWDIQPNADPGNGGYLITSASGSWPGPIDGSIGRFGRANRMNGQYYWDTKCVAVGIRVPIANLSIRMTGLQVNGTTNISRVKVMKRGSI